METISEFYYKEWKRAEKEGNMVYAKRRKEQYFESVKGALKRVNEKVNNAFKEPYTQRIYVLNARLTLYLN